MRHGAIDLGLVMDLKKGVQSGGARGPGQDLDFLVGEGADDGALVARGDVGAAGVFPRVMRVAALP